MHLIILLRTFVSRPCVLGFIFCFSSIFNSAFGQLSADTATSRFHDESVVWHEYGKGLHVFQSAHQNSIVLVGEDGVLIMDPYNPGYARALKGAIKKRFNLPVKYVVYSHSHADHIRGANVFSDTAKFIAQQNILQRMEFLLPYEDSIVMPDITFDNEYKLDFGGREILLKYYGINHGDGYVVMHLPQDKMVVVFDIIYPKRFLWYTLNDYSPRGILHTLKEVYKTDFETCLTGHGRPATRAEFKEFMDFWEDLITQVNDVIKRHFRIKGPFATLEIVLKEVDTSKYKDWGFYEEWRDKNLEGIYQSIFVGF